MDDLIFFFKVISSVGIVIVAFSGFIMMIVAFVSIYYQEPRRVDER